MKQENNFKFNLENVDKVTGTELSEILRKQSLAGRADGMEQFMTMAVSSTVTSLSHLMIISNGGEWDQKMFSELGDHMKHSVEMLLKRFEHMRKTAEENPDLMAKIRKSSAQDLAEMARKLK